MAQYYQNPLTIKTKSVNNRKPSHEYLPTHTVMEIHKLLRNVFNQSIKKELMSRNLIQNATLPKEEHKEHDIWTVNILFKALDVCNDNILSLALNVAFSCSLRMSKLLGLIWNCIDISKRNIKNDCANIFVNKEIQRVNCNTIEHLEVKSEMFKFLSLKYYLQDEVQQRRYEFV